MNTYPAMGDVLYRLDRLQELVAIHNGQLTILIKLAQDMDERIAKLENILGEPPSHE